MGEKEVTNAMVYFRTPLRKSIQKTNAKDCGVVEPMTTTTASTGRLGEELAEAYLRSRGFHIHERNVRCGRFEIDIVAFDPVEKMVVFVEVKTRTMIDPRYPVRTMVDGRKRSAMKQAIFRWVERHRYEGSARTDIVCVAGGRIVDHVVNIGADFY